MRKVIQKYLQSRMNIIMIFLSILGGSMFIDAENLSVPLTSISPHIDGSQDDIWNSTDVVDMDKYVIISGETGNPTNTADLTCNFRALWDETYLYLYICITDDEINLANPNTWEQDGIELFFDGNNLKTIGAYDGIDDINIRFIQTAENTGDIIYSPDYTDFNPDRVQFVIQDAENGWNMEVALPLEDLNINSAVGTLFGFEIQYNDNDSGDRDHIARWHLANNDTWFNASLMGTAQLANPPEFGKDLGIVSIDLDAVVLINSAQTIKVDIENFGSEPQSNFSLAYQIGTQTPVVETYSGSVASQSTVEYTFQTSWTPGQLGSVTVTGYTSLTGDENTSNDRKQKTVSVARQKDVGISAISMPSKVGVNKPCTISVEITNYGKDSQSNFPVSYRIGSGSWVTENYSGSIAAGAKKVYNFSQKWTPASTGTYTVTAQTVLSGDQNSDNDSRQKDVEVVNAAYMGSWRGTTSQNRPIFFHVSAEDQIDSISVEMRVNFGSASCTNVFSGGLTVIQNDTFAAGVDAYPAVWNSEVPIVRGHFTSSSSCTGTITEHVVVGGLCGGLIIGTGYTNSSQTWTASQDLIDNVEEMVQAPETMRLMQNYPNPFNPTTTIEYSLPQRMVVSLKVYDVTGREVMTLVKGEQSSGDHRLEFNNSDLPSGIYLYRLQTQNFLETRKMIIIE
jgi:hypothetical protein